MVNRGMLEFVSPSWLLTGNPIPDDEHPFDNTNGYGCHVSSLVNLKHPMSVYHFQIY